MINEAALSRQFCERHPAEAAAVLMHVAPEAAAAFLTALAPAHAARLLQHLLPAQGAAILSQLPAELLPAILARLDLTEAAGLLRPLTAARREALMAALPAPQRERLARAVGFPPDTVGSLLTAPPLALLEEWTVKFSLREYKRVVQTPVTELPVVDQQQRLVGTVSLHRLLTERDDLRVGTLADDTLPALPADAALGAVAQHPVWDRSTAAPVIDLDGKLLGVLHHGKLHEYLAGRQPQGLAALTPFIALAEVYWTASSALVAMLGERLGQPHGRTEQEQR